MSYGSELMPLLFFQKLCPAPFSPVLLLLCKLKMHQWGVWPYQCFLCIKNHIKNRQHIKKQRHHFADSCRQQLLSVHFVKAMAFPVVMYECENWTIKNTERQRIESFWNVLLAKTLESPLDCKKIQPVNPKGNQLWIFTGRTHIEAPILWPPDAKNQLIGKDPDAGKGWGQEE